MARDGALGEEEGGRDLLVRPALGDEGRDTELTLRQLAARGRAAADPAQLRAGLLRPERRPSWSNSVSDSPRVVRAAPVGVCSAARSPEREQVRAR